VTSAILSTLGLGMVLGLRHATDADHVAAMSAIISREGSVRGSALAGMMWGVGHALTLLAAGGLVLASGIGVPARLALGLELAVAVMIVALGARLLLVGGGWGSADALFGSHIHGPGERRPAGRGRALLVGGVHGLAGSAAITLIVVSGAASRGSTFLALAFLLLFGLGAILGMASMSALMALPFRAASARAGRSVVWLRIGVAVASTLFGVLYGWGVLKALTL
jgi:hypothetical protein